MDPKILREATLAYQAVYDENLRQELAEEQVWEQVESWVNSLLEEGYDLSDYTWEEMYESYLNEMGQRMTTGQATAPKAPPIVQSKPINRIAGGGMGGMRGSGRDRNPTQTSSSPGALRVNPTARPATQPPAAKPAPTAPAAKPAPTAPAAKPAPTAPAAKPGTPVPGPNVKPNPTAPSAPPSPASAPAPAPAPTPAPAPAPTKRFDIRDRDPRARGGFDPRFDKKPVAQMLQAKEPYQPAKPPVSVQRATPKGPREKMLNQDLDLFDVIKGHLLDEGYADNEDAALAIMANMSEEWKQSIVEAQEARNNPEEYERKEAKKKSKKQRAMEDPHTGINSPAFEKFMRQQMGR